MLFHASSCQWIGLLLEVSLWFPLCFEIFYSMKYPKMMLVMLPRHDQNLSLNPSYQNTISHYNVASHGYPKSIK